MSAVGITPIPGGPVRILAQGLRDEKHQPAGLTIPDTLQTCWSGEGLSPDHRLSQYPPPWDPEPSPVLCWAGACFHLRAPRTWDPVAPIHCLANSLGMVSEESFPRRAEERNDIETPQKSHFWNFSLLVMISSSFSPKNKNFSPHHESPA